MEFYAGSEHTAKAVMHNPTSIAFDYLGVLFMGINQATMVEVSFHLEAGESKEVVFPVIMPTALGDYPVYIGVFSGGAFLEPLRQGENVTIITQAAAEFYMPALIDFWLEHEIIVGNYVHRVTWGVTATNNGNAPATKEVTFWRSYPPDGGETKVVSVTLNPGESIFLQAYRTDYQFAYIHQLFFSATGNWVGNNFAEGHMDSNGDVDIGNVVLETHREW